MKKILICLACIFSANLTCAKEMVFKEENPNTPIGQIQSVGAFKIFSEFCDLNKIQKTVVDNYIENVPKIIHFYHNIPYEEINLQIELTKKHIEKTQTSLSEKECSRIFSNGVKEFSTFPDNLIWEQIYTKVKSMPKEELPKLNKEYLYKNNFVSEELGNFSAEYVGGVVWIGTAMPHEQCVNEMRNSLSAAYCENGYKKWPIQM